MWDDATQDLLIEIACKNAISFNRPLLMCFLYKSGGKNLVGYCSDIKAGIPTVYVHKKLDKYFILSFNSETSFKLTQNGSVLCYDSKISILFWCQGNGNASILLLYSVESLTIFDYILKVYQSSTGN